MNRGAVGRLLGIVLLLMACFLLVPALVGAGLGEFSDALACLYSSLATAVVGLALALRFRGRTHKPDGRPDWFRREGLAVVGLSWVVGGMAGALPFLFCGTLGPVDAYFESVSGMTTTGSTVMSGVQIDGMSHAIQFWRQFSHWLGGFGIVMVFVVLFPTGGRSLFRSEIPGVSREAGHQRVRDSAMSLLRIYTGITVIEFALLLWTGIGTWDALMHALATIPTGGFSNHSQSIAYFSNVGVEVIITSFMFLSGLNFALYDTLLRVGPRPFLRRLWGSSEARAYAGIAAGATVVVALVLWFDGGSNGDTVAFPPAEGWKDYSSFWLCLRDSSFQVVCMQTSTGFGTANFDVWPEVTRMLLMSLAVVGACAGSTGGGIKMVRMMIVAKAAIAAVRHFVRPRAIQAVRMDGVSLDNRVVASITGYFAMWVLVFLAGTLFLTCYDIDLVTAGTAVLATLNNIGPGLGRVGPSLNFAELPVLVKLVLSIFMILGRLEFYAVVALFVPGFWKR